jgi:hypothetical protein
MSVLGDIAGAIAKTENLGTVGKIAQMLGTVGEVGGTIYEGVSAEQQSRVAAASVMRRAGYEAKLRRKEGKRLVGTQQTRYAKSGVEPTGTPLEVMSESIREAEMDALMIEMGGEEEARQYREAGRGQMMSSLISGGSTLLTRAGGLLKDKKRKTTSIPSTKYPWSNLNFPKAW